LRIFAEDRCLTEATCFSLVVPDGYGLSYSIGDNNIRWTITSLKRDTLRLKHYLAEAATETRQMMERAAAAEKNKKEEEAKAKL
jgi:carnitine O-acetyltransferase